MRSDLYFSRLYGLANDKQTDPKSLARAIVKTLVQVSDMNPAGTEAVQLVRNTMLRETLRSHVGIGRRAGRPRGSKNKAKVELVNNKDEPIKRTMSPETRAKISATAKKRYREKRRRANDTASTVTA